MKKVKLKYFPADRSNVLKAAKCINGISNINMTEGVFTFMRGTAIVEMNEEDFDKNFRCLKSKIKSVCSKAVKVIVYN